MKLQITPTDYMSHFVVVDVNSIWNKGGNTCARSKKLWKTIIRKGKEKNVLFASSPPVVCAYPNNINTCNGNANEDEIKVTAEEVNYNKDDDDNEDDEEEEDGDILLR